MIVHKPNAAVAIAVAVLTASIFTGAAWAQSEATHWYVPAYGNPLYVRITNLTNEPLEVEVRAAHVNGTFASLSRRTIDRGATHGANYPISSSINVPYLLVVAEAPVVVSATTATFGVANVAVILPAYPIDCAHAAPRHFACDQQVGGQLNGPGTVGERAREGVDAPNTTPGSSR